MANTFQTYLFIAPTLVLALSGCSIRHFDPSTGTERLYGFGYMSMRVAEPRESLQAVVKETTTFGANASVGREDIGFSVGWDRRRRLSVLNTNTAVRFDWPDNSLMNVRVGTNVPPAIENLGKTQKTIP